MDEGGNASCGASWDSLDPGGILPPRARLGLIVPCYTPERFDDILRLLDSVARQTSPVDEMVVVVQQSRELLELLRDRLERLTTVRARLLFLNIPPRVSMARNYGVRKVESDIVAFVDDDSVLAEDWASMTQEFYRGRPDAIGAAGAILPLWDSPAMKWFPRELYWILSCTYWTWTSPTLVRNGYGANMSFRREAFDGGRSFNESFGISGWGSKGWQGMGGEEPELSMRVSAETGRPILYVPDIRAWHRVKSHRLTLRSIVRRAYWEGRLKAALSRNPTRPANLLHTEWSLLRDMARAQFGRMRLLVSCPLVALRQELVVLLVVAVVFLGFVDGKLRGYRVDGVGGSAV